MGEPFCAFIDVDGLVYTVVEIGYERVSGIGGAESVTFRYEVQGVSGEAW